MAADRRIGARPARREPNRPAVHGRRLGAFLFPTLTKFDLTEGAYQGRPGDGFRLRGAFIANAAACVPPQNRPTPQEVRNCRPFLDARLRSLPQLRVLLALGAIAHDSVLRAMGERPSRYRFAHGARHDVPGGLVLFDSYHCSRQNTNTGRLTLPMFEDVFAAARASRP